MFSIFAKVKKLREHQTENVMLNVKGGKESNSRTNDRGASGSNCRVIYATIILSIQRFSTKISAEYLVIIIL